MKGRALRSKLVEKPELLLGMGGGKDEDFVRGTRLQWTDTHRLSFLVRVQILSTLSSKLNLFGKRRFLYAIRRARYADETTGRSSWAGVRARHFLCEPGDRRRLEQTGQRQIHPESLSNLENNSRQ